MELSYDIISQFAKVINEDKGRNQGIETTVYGVVVSDGNGNKYVKLDGSDQLTPLSDNERPSADSTTANTNVGDRVTVSIKNHTATVTGNVSSPSVRTDDFNDLSSGVDKISKFNTVLADRVQANEGYIKKLQSDKAEIGDLTAATAKITELEAKKANVEDLNAAKAEIDDLKTKKLDAEVANIKYATVESLKATDVKVGKISGQQAKFEETTTNKLIAVEGTIDKLDTEKLSTKDADIKYAQVDFANIGKAAIEHFYATSGIIKDLVIGDTTVSGKLVGVTIIGDLIEGGTVKADKLVIQGTDGLYYKLNTDGMKTTAEQTEYNSLNGSIITAKSITAEKVNIHDLVAFGATIAGFNINETAIYSGVKDHPDIAVRGIYLDKDGQVSFGDATSYLKYYKDSNGLWRLEIAADNVRFSSSKKTLAEEINDIKTDIEKTIVSVDVEYYLSTSATSTVGGSWSTLPPPWVNGKYMWSRTVTTYNTGNVEYSPNQNGVCIAGATGSTGNAGKGVVSIVEEYYKSTSSSSLAGGSWSGVYPGWENDTYVWTRSIITYTDNTTTTTEAICVTGSKGEKGDTGPQGIQGLQGPKGEQGDKGATGAAGKGVKSTDITYQASTSGTTIPTDTWSTSIPTVPAGSFLWTRTIITYTDNSKSTSYSIGKMGSTGATGLTGAAGKGVKSTDITYQAGSSGTTAPTGNWLTTIPDTSANKPFLWTKTTITYTDDDISTIYSVGSTPDSIQVGGRNLYKGTKDFTGDTWINNGEWSSDGTVDGFAVKERSKAPGMGLVQSINAEVGDVYTYSAYVKTDTPGNISCIWYCGTRTTDSANATILKAASLPIVANIYTKIALTFEVTKSGIVRPGIEPQNSDGNVWVYGIKVEKGNKATDWTPAPEDIDNRFDAAETRITQAETSIETTNNQIALKASTETVTEIGNRANQLDKALSDALTTIKQNSDAIATLTARDFKVEFTTLTNQLTQLNGDLTSYKKEVGNWMRFDADGNLVLGATREEGQDAYELKLTKSRISFMLNDVEVAYISNNELYITNSTVVQNLKIGRFIWEVRGNGNLGLVWR